MSVVEDVLTNLLTDRPISDLNRHYLKYLRAVYTPKVIYDIGASNISWTKFSTLIFPKADYYLFDADPVFSERYKNYKHFITCLSCEDDLELPFYNVCKYNDERVKSCYQSELLENDAIIVKTKKLDTLVKENNLPTPDLVKINCCGAEKSIIEGAEETLKNCKYIIVNMSNNDVWVGAPLASETGPYIESLGFEMVDALDSYGNKMIDYVFKNKNI